MKLLLRSSLFALLAVGSIAGLFASPTNSGSKASYTLPGLCTTCGTAPKPTTPTQPSTSSGVR